MRTKLIIFISLCLLGGLVYAYRQLRYQTPQCDCGMTEEQCIPCISPSPTIKQYVNTNPDFSFNYPDEVSIKSESNGSTPLNQANDLLTHVQIQDKPTESEYVTFWIYASKLSIQDWVKEKIPDAKFVQPFSNNYVQGMEYGLQIPAPDKTIQRFYIWEKNETIYVLSNNINTGLSDRLTSLILSTFRFTQSSKESDQNNNERHYVLAYPAYLKTQILDNPYPEGGPQEQIKLICENDFELNHEEGSPHCINGGGIRIWYNPDLGWVGGCDEANQKIIILGGNKQSACVYETGFNILIQNNLGDFLISATYSEQLTKAAVDQILASFRFID